MATYAIGDVQGCYDELQALLAKIHFDPHVDQLWFVGDLVNRGPKSLDVLRFIKQLPKPAVITLGNHDLHLLAVAAGVQSKSAKDTLDEILQADDCEQLCSWLAQQHLVYHDATLGFTMVHAGLIPQWDLATALTLNQEIEYLLQGNARHDFFKHMYGDQPDTWNDDLPGWERARFIINCFTRIRYCTPASKLDLATKTPIGTQPQGFLPWFKIPDRQHKSLQILFGHWASLEGKIDEPNVYALDTGCVWGGWLTALCLQTKEKFQVKSNLKK